jgi:hypothetical protein
MRSRWRRSSGSQCPFSNIEAEAVENGILFRPVSVVDRQEARQQLGALLDRVHAQVPPSDQSPQEEEITRIIKELRQDDATVRGS